jgi:regulator of protease activity HflC (stomatin/prohibitin superfamily)
MGMFVLAGVVLIGLVCVARGLRMVRENERLVILRLGRYVGVRGPGLVVMVPVIDLSMRVALDKEIPGWRGMTPEGLERAIRQRLGM